MRLRWSPSKHLMLMMLYLFRFPHKWPLITLVGWRSGITIHLHIYVNVLLLLDAAVINFVICFLHPQRRQQLPLHAGNSNSEKWEFTAGKPAAQVNVDEPAIYLPVVRRLDLRWKRGRLLRCLHVRTGIAYTYAIQVRASIFILLCVSNL